MRGCKLYCQHCCFPTVKCYSTHSGLEEKKKIINCSFTATDLLNETNRKEVQLAKSFKSNSRTRQTSHYPKTSAELRRIHYKIWQGPQTGSLNMTNNDLVSIPQSHKGKKYYAYYKSIEYKTLLFCSCYSLHSHGGMVHYLSNLTFCRVSMYNRQLHITFYFM